MNENKNETTFENAQIGDKVYYFYDHYWREGTIVKITPQKYFQLFVEFDRMPNLSFTFDGKHKTTAPQSLFWGIPQIIAPPRPEPVEKIKVAPYKILIRIMSGSHRLLLLENLFANDADLIEYIKKESRGGDVLIKCERLTDWEIEIPANEYKYGGK